MKNGRMRFNFVTSDLDGFASYYGSNSHVLMWYFRGFDIDSVREKEISFNFRIVDKFIVERRRVGEEEEEKESPTFKVERCGIRMLQL